MAGWTGTWVTVDPSDAVALRHAVERVAPEVVVHAAVARGGRHEARIDVELTMARAVCAAVEATDVRTLITFGSAAEYGAHEPPLRETLEPLPRTSHGVAKAAGVAAVLAWAATVQTTTLVLRPFHVVGPGEPLDKLLPRAIAAAQGGPPLPLVAGGPVRDIVGVDDVVNGVLAAIDDPPLDGVPVNLCSGMASRVEDVVAAVEDALGTAVAVEGAHPRSELDDERRIGDPTRAAELWGWRASPLQETVRSALEAWPWRTS